MFNGLPQGVKRKFGSSNNDQNGTNGVNGHHAEDEDDEGNDWSEDEDGIDSAPMDVSFCICSWIYSN
jgi:DNA-directed RNA polymerase III subunit RPC3